ncbi:MAG: ATP-binding cassette domain-containing protein [Epsilonproteobacteria bacterium]|nr:ATP-binding cassette domain-containing protein [Campylobacterota bacterium]
MIYLDISKKLQGALGEMKLTCNLRIEKGEFIAISGESGSGKTTFLRIIAGLEEADANIKVNNKVWQSDRFSLPPQKREVGFVFQDYALFENMTVEQNLLYVSKDKELASYLLEVTKLTELKKRYPSSLSGGQKQRVALCRALMKKPKILLLDEPLSALDPSMRHTLQQEILQLHKEFGMTTFMVSHDPSEIYKLSSRVLVLSHGKIIQDDTPKEILLKTNGSQKFSFEGEILEIKKIDVIYIATVAIGQQIVEVVISKGEGKTLFVSQKVKLSTKAFAPIITPLEEGH